MTHHLTADPPHTTLARSVDRYLGRALPPMFCADRLEKNWNVISLETERALAEYVEMMGDRK